MDARAGEAALSPIWRCSCGYWEPRYERAVNAIPTCPYCFYQVSTRGKYHYVALSKAFRPEPIVDDALWDC